MRADIGLVYFSMLLQPSQKPGKQRHIAVRRHAKMHVRRLGGHGPARVDGDDFHLRPPVLRRHDALEQDRVAPGEIGADKDNQVRLFQILIVSRHRVRAERAAVAGDG